MIARMPWTFEPEIRAALQRHGWRVDRNFEVNAIQRAWQDGGYDVFDAHPIASITANDSASPAQPAAMATNHHRRVERDNRTACQDRAARLTAKL
ncbi:hypothetical protein LC55x_3053 [Lysobacter capsici]|nr:hypothetical protein LC55x_3053 [Lysobacter capsici]